MIPQSWILEKISKIMVFGHVRNDIEKYPYGQSRNIVWGTNDMGREFWVSGIALGGQTCVKIVLAERNALLRRGLRSVIDSDERFSVEGEAGDLSAAWDLLEKKHPDILLLSLDGLQTSFIVKVRRQLPNTKILLLAHPGATDLVLDGLRMGVSGCVFRSDTPEEITDALARVSRGESVICAPMRDALVNSLIHPDRNRGANEPYKELTERETQVVNCLVEGMCNKEIASHLGLTVRTVKAHVSKILQKMGVSDRTQIVVKVLRKTVNQ